MYRRSSNSKSCFAVPVLLCGIVAATMGTPGASGQSSYKLTDLSQLGAASARDVNNAGEVAGMTGLHGYVYADLNGDLEPDAGELVDLGVLAGPYDYSQAFAINELGVACGESRASDNLMHAIRWSASLEDLGPGSASGGHGYGRAINAAGEVAGYLYGVGGAGYRAVRWSGGSWTDLWTWGTGEGGANDINDARQIVGWRYFVGQSGRRAFLWSNGVATDLGQLGGEVNWAEATAINQHGWITGWCNTASGETHAFLWVPYGPNAATGTMYDLGTLGGNYSAAYGINNRGEVVGVARNSFDQDHAFLYTNGRMVDLQGALPPNSPAFPNVAYAINDVGQIVGDSNLGGILITPNDSDGDGIPDEWEDLGGGIDSNRDGTIDLDLFALGARPDHKDLFVEVDAMSGRAPHPNAMEWVTLAFDRAPVENPDGVTGVKLHVIVDETDLPLQAWSSMTDVDGDGTGDWPTGFDGTKAARFGTAAERAHANAANILAAKRLAFRYCVFADRYGGGTSSGIAELPGNDFIVTLGAWTPAGGEIADQAGTFMHELGHTLGLRHGGGDHINHKPNYDSVMNYSFQTALNWNDGYWAPRYSSQVLPTLNEADLNEHSGFGGSAAVHVAVGPPNAVLVRMSGAVDLNRDGDAGDAGLAVDLTHVDPSVAASPGEVLRGYDDWEHIAYGVSGNGDFLEGQHASVVSLKEMTAELRDILNGLSPSCDACDVNCNGTVNPFDIQPFLSVLNGGTRCSPCAGDANGDGTVNPFDINGFLECLSS